MWDIKVTIIRMIEETTQFYPNHVGYKAVRTLSADTRTIGFIRTMWDIKVTIIRMIEETTQFYPNHVGYKGINIVVFSG